MNMNITAIHVAVICGARYIAPSGGYAYASSISMSALIRKECVAYILQSLAHTFL